MSGEATLPRRLTVRFATTDGLILDANVDDPRFVVLSSLPIDLGQCCFIGENDLIIVDRTYSDDCCRLNVDDIAKFIVYILKHVTTPTTTTTTTTTTVDRFDEVLVYLPKMKHQIVEETYVQTLIRGVYDRVRLILV